MTDLISRSKLLDSVDSQLRVQKICLLVDEGHPFVQGVVAALEAARVVISAFPAAPAPEPIQVPTVLPERLQLLEDLYEAVGDSLVNPDTYKEYAALRLYDDETEDTQDFG